MPYAVQAFYEKGVFKPTESVRLREHTRVRLIVEALGEERESPEDWARRMLATFGQKAAVSSDDPFGGGLTVKEYLALSEPTRRALWDRWHQEATADLEKGTGADTHV